MSVENRSIPGWPELITNAADFGMATSCDDLDRLERAASNSISSILDGLAAVGELQWRAAQYTEAPIAPETLHMLGDFHLTLAALLTKLHSVEGDANFQRQQLELAEAKGEATA